MFLTILISVLITLWIIFCSVLYSYHYVVEVVLDLPISGQSPCTAHTVLKQLIERLLQEVVNLPSLQKAQDDPAVSSDGNNRTYEDLLATAIINKVISSCQNNLPASSAASVSSRISNSSRNRDNREYFFGEETLDSKWKTTDLDTSSVSSLEEWIQSDSSRGSKKYVDRVTLTIKQDIEEISQTDSENENEEDDTDYFRSSSLLNDDDEPNWFLQKRQFQGTHSPVPVPMLVPNPTTEAKVLIGDREVDDTSDLSDVASDYGETETVPGRQSLLLESKTVIGGKNPLRNGGSESESSADSGVKEVDSRDRSGYDGPIFISKTDITVDDDNVEDASILSVYSNTEKEAEYTEKYGSLPRTIMKTPTPPSRPSLQKSKFPGSTKVDDDDDANKEIEKSQQSDDEEERKIMEFGGRYSKREKEKWKHAIEMKNNPYSKENIEKRIQRSSSAVSSLFGPDYYARQASSPSGGKLASSELKELKWPPPRSKEEEENENIHKAVPAIVTPEDDVFHMKQVDSEHITPKLKPQAGPAVDVADLAVSEVTSDSDLSYVNFYDVENSQIYRKTKDGEEVTLIKAKALSEEPSKEKSDENGNLASEKDKHPSAASREDNEIVTNEIPKVVERKTISRSKVEDKPNFAKATPLVRQRTIPQPSSTRNLKRFKSETDLLDDSFDRPPTVIGRKKDNTLISKIYLDPHVRSFALLKRDHLPMEESLEAKPPLKNQLSVDSNVFAFATEENDRQAFYNSDDNVSLSNSRKKSYYSSEEDLLNVGNSPISKGDSPVSKIYQNASVKNYRLKSSRQSVSSEDGLLSDQGSINLDKPYRVKSTRSLIYSSNEDLLSIDDTEIVPKKKDNTLIFKIYQDPNVRNFALTNREYIPVPEDKISVSSKKSYSSEEDLLSDHSSSKTGSKYKTHDEHKATESNKNPAIDELNLESCRIEEAPSSQHLKVSKKELSEREMRPITSPDPDIDELARRKIVHNLLGQFSKSTPHLVDTDSGRKISDGRKLSMGMEEAKVSVKDLKKKFENHDVKNTVISSLTARSLPKQMRETLRN